MKNQASPEYRFFQLQSISQPFILDDDSPFVKVLEQEPAELPLIDAGRAFVKQHNDQISWKFVPALRSESEVRGFETVTIDEIEFCMPFSMLEALAGYFLDANNEELLLRNANGAYVSTKGL